MSWSELKKFINSSVGTSESTPLDQQLQTSKTELSNQMSDSEATLTGLLNFLKNKFFQTYYKPSDTVIKTISSSEIKNNLSENKATVTIGTYTFDKAGCVTIKASLKGYIDEGYYSAKLEAKYVDRYGVETSISGFSMSTQEADGNSYKTYTTTLDITEKLVNRPVTFTLGKSGTYGTSYCNLLTINGTVVTEEIAFDGVNGTIINDAG